MPANSGFTAVQAFRGQARSYALVPALPYGLSADWVFSGVESSGGFPGTAFSTGLGLDSGLFLPASASLAVGREFWLFSGGWFVSVRSLPGLLFDGLRSTSFAGPDWSAAAGRSPAVFSTGCRLSVRRSAAGFASVAWLWAAGTAVSGAFSFFCLVSVP